MAVIVIHVWTHVESFEDMWCPRSTICWLNVGENLDAGGSKGGLIVIERSMDLGICGEAGVDAGVTE